MSENAVRAVLWVVDYRLEQRTRRWFRAFAPEAPVRAELLEELAELYGERACLVELRPATDAERHEYLAGNQSFRAIFGD